jgi:hypothetical protein
MQQLDPDPPKIKDFSFHKDSIYRWLKTDVSGTDERLLKIENGFAVFQSGRKCNLQLLQEFMDPISAGPDMTAQNKANYNSLTAGLQVESAQPKHPEQLPGFANEFTDPELKTQSQVKVKPSRVVKEIPKPVQKPKSPVRLILDSNKSSMTLKSTLEIDTIIPDKDIFRVLKNSFPDSDILDEVAEKILSEMDTKEIIEELKEMIKSNLSTTYSGSNEDK